MRSRSVLFGLVLTATQLTIGNGQTPSAPARTPVMFTGLSDLHHPTSTRNPEAQQFFDQGLRLIYAFNHEEAVRSFQHAVQLDPQFAMAWWGVAVAVGPNYNSPVDPEREKAAVDAVQHAVNLSTAAPPIEQDYIRAIATRFSASGNPNYQELNINYSRAMRDLSHKYPDDLDAATLY